MGYVPGYTESIAGLAAAFVGGAWLSGRGFPWVRHAVSVAGLVVFGGMLGATALIASGDPAVMDDPRMRAARWAPFAVVAALLAVEVVLVGIVRRRPPADEAPR